MKRERVTKWMCPCCNNYHKTRKLFVRHLVLSIKLLTDAIVWAIWEGK